VEEQVRAGLLTRDQARSHAQRNVITRCLGTQIDVEVDVFPEFLSQGDTLLLCTDGLSGSINEEDVYSIINQFVPQESVYHLVERANENGGPDNITAIVVRVLDVGSETPPIRYPVPAGNHEAGSDAAQNSVSTSSLGISSQTEGSTKWNASPEAPTGPLPAVKSSSPHSSTTAHLKHPTRHRLLYPTLALIAILVALFSGGAYYAIFSSNNLSNAQNLIDQANTKLPDHPEDALRDLSQAQQALFSTQGSLQVGDQASKYNTLKEKLRQSFQKTITAYNQKELITQLQPTCTASQSVRTLTNVEPTSLSIIADEKPTPYSYVLGSDRNLYQLDGQHQLTTAYPFKNSTSVLKLTGSGQHLFALTQSGNPTAFSITLFSFDQAPTLKDDPAPLDNTLMSQGWSPQFLASYEADVYVILTSKTVQHQAMVLHYDANNWQKPPQSAEISLSSDMVSVVASAQKRLFLLTSDGLIKTLQYGENGGTPPVEDLSLQNPVSPPLALDETKFAVSTPIATAVPASSQVITSSTSNKNVLVVGSVNEKLHLYLVDNSNHRIMDLEFQPGQPVPTATSATATSTSSTGGGAVSQPSLRVDHQFVFSTVLPSIQSATVGPDGKQLHLLQQDGHAITTISSLDTVPSC
jgi:hypothetical protein